MTENSDNLRDIVAEVAAAYFSNSHVSPNDIPHVVKQIADSLSAVGGGGAMATEAVSPPEQSGPTPAQIRKSITPAALISFEDGKPYKTLRRHLRTHGLTPEQYRQKYGLPADYPLVASNYSATRSNLAKSMGLGQGGARKKATPAAIMPAPAQAKAAPKPKARRKAKAQPKTKAPPKANAKPRGRPRKSA